MKPNKTTLTTDKRSTVISLKTTSYEKEQIALTAKRCGMTVSDFLRARALGYKPLARLTKEECEKLSQLSYSRVDIINFANVLSAISEDEKLPLFHNEYFMQDWYNRTQKVIDGVIEYLKFVQRPNKVKTPNFRSTDF